MAERVLLLLLLIVIPSYIDADLLHLPDCLLPRVRPRGERVLRRPLRRGLGAMVIDLLLEAGDLSFLPIYGPLQLLYYNLLYPL